MNGESVKRDVLIHDGREEPKQQGVYILLRRNVMTGTNVYSMSWWYDCDRRWSGDPAAPVDAWVNLADIFEGWKRPD